LPIARELGATHTLDANETDDTVWSVLEIADGPGLEFSVETVGAGPVVRQALEVLRSPGTCATLGLAGLENEVTIDQGHLLIGRTLTGVIEGDADPQRFIPALIERWCDGRFPFDRLLTRFPFAELNAAISALASGEVIKPLVVFG
jgi:aryl-alcohol dehydrogenase